MEGEWINSHVRALSYQIHCLGVDYSEGDSMAEKTLKRRSLAFSVASAEETARTQDRAEIFVIASSSLGYTRLKPSKQAQQRKKWSRTGLQHNKTNQKRLSREKIKGRAPGSVWTIRCRCGHRRRWGRWWWDRRRWWCGREWRARSSACSRTPPPSSSPAAETAGPGSAVWTAPLLWPPDPSPPSLSISLSARALSGVSSNFWRSLSL